MFIVVSIAILAALIFGGLYYSDIQVSNRIGTANAIEEGESKTAFTSFARYHAAAEAFVLANPGFTGVIPQPDITARLDSRVNPGPWQTYVGVDGRIVTFHPQGPNAKVYATGLATPNSMAKHFTHASSGQGFATGSGNYVAMQGSATLPLPDGGGGPNIPFNTPVFVTDLRRALLTDAPEIVVERLTSACPPGADGEISTIRTTRRHSDGTVDLLRPDTTFSRCLNAIEFHDYQFALCDVAHPERGYRIERRSNQYRPGAGTPITYGVFQPWLNTCITIATGSPETPSVVDISAPVWSASSTTLSQSLSCPPDHTGSITQQRTQTVANGPFGQVVDLTQWVTVSNTCAYNPPPPPPPPDGGGGYDNGGGETGADGVSGADSASTGADGPGGVGGDAGDGGGGDGGGGDGGGGGCYVTTAACTYAALPDDCNELTMMRRLRDKYSVLQPLGEIGTGIYDYVAPIIVQNIEAHPQSASIYAEVMEKFIKPGALLVQQNSLQDAWILYRAMFAHAWLTHIKGEQFAQLAEKVLREYYGIHVSKEAASRVMRSRLESLSLSH